MRAPTDTAVQQALADTMATERLRIVAALIHRTGNWDAAEDAVADAAERALRRWPQDGVPDNPAAWLTRVAVRRAIDLARRREVERAKLAQIADLDRRETLGAFDPPDRSPVTDDRLRLVFTCCHPALSLEARVALTLKVVAGLSTAAIGRAFLTSEATMSQRVLRAKRKIANAGIPYRVPTAAMLPERLEGVLAVVYLVFTDGYATTDHTLAEEAIRLGRLLVELMPGHDEPRALLALLLLQHSRRSARLVDGELVTLPHQDRSRWDTAAIEEARALQPPPGAGRGRYRIEADLAAVHADAAGPDDTDWLRIVSLYDELLEIAPSPVVELNRAIAVGMCDSPLAGLAGLDTVVAEGRLGDHYLVFAARADLLARAGRPAEAVTDLDHAIEGAPTSRERRQLDRRRAQLLPRQEP
ncbi:MAG: sigma-70 family RNA polymerase sigma factor [Propionibacteriales bacterium]|nr:sigma-70 family RNA polymerase sigma factor [Propionibacteriales bacterium]